MEALSAVVAGSFCFACFFREQTSNSRTEKYVEYSMPQVYTALFQFAGLTAIEWNHGRRDRHRWWLVIGPGAGGRCER